MAVKPKRRPGEGLRDYEKRIGAAAGSIKRKQPGQAAQPAQTVQETEREIYDAQSDLNLAGIDKAQEIIEPMGAFAPEAYPEMRQMAFDKAYGLMSKDLEKNKARDRANLEQTLHNRGIPIDPNDPQYQKWMGDLESKYADQDRYIRDQAYLSSGGEEDRAYNQQQGTYTTNVGAADAFSQLGTGAKDPRITNTALNETRANIKYKNAATANMGKSSGGSSGSSTPQDEGFGYY